MFKDVLAPVPQTIYSTSDYEKTFYPTTKHDLKVGNNYVGIPLEIDTLALFINTDMFQAAGLQTPKTWLDVRTAAKALTVTDKATGQIQTAGAALGTYDNVDGAADIVSLMMLQNNVNFAAINKSVGADGRNLGEDVLAFYTQFSTDQRVWSNDLDPSTLAFAKGRAGMYIGYSWRIFDIKALNPSLKFTIVPVPQVSETTPNKLTYASYWAEGVSKKSPYQAQAFTLLKYLSSSAVEQKLFAEDAKVRGIGMPYSRVDLALQGKQNEFISPFLELAPNAQSWYFASNTGDSDSGLVGGLTNYFGSAIRDTSSGKLSPKSALDQLANGIAQKLSDYKITP
jgi:multiple sugar transport system substrate-binding protein